MRRGTRLAWLFASSLVLLACAEPDEATSTGKGGKQADDAALDASAGGGGAQAQLVYLGPTEHLVRASMALRGIRPSLEELAAVRDDPRYLKAIVDYYLTTPEFGVTMRELHAETLLSGVDPVIYPAGFRPIGELAGLGLHELNQSIVDAPLRLIEHVIANDRPYAEIVTADYTLADAVVAAVFGMPYDASGETWQETHYEDGRPHAGILSDSFLFTRHSTTYSNMSRGRANQVSRALLCYDFLSRDLPIDTSINLADTAAVTDAVKNNPNCSTCHDSLDPLAAYFSVFRPIYVPSNVDSYPYSIYVPNFASFLRASKPAFGELEGGELAQLGAAIAADPMFTLCAAKRFYAFFNQLSVDEVPAEVAYELQELFIDSGMDAKALARAIVLSDAFRVSHVEHAVSTSENDGEELVGLRKVRPEQLARTLEDLTGYRWQTTLPFDFGAGTVGDVDLLTDAFFGFKVLGGGIDSVNVTRPSNTQSATSALVMNGLAARAAKHVVEGDLARADKTKRKLLRLVDEDDSSESAVRAQLAALSLRLYGTELAADAPEVDDAYALYTAALGGSPGRARRAWTITLHALLQDPRMAFY